MWMDGEIKMQKSKAKSQKSKVAVSAFCVLPFAICLSLALTARAETINRILATVDGDPITLYELTQYGERDIRARQQGASMDRAALLDALITEKIVQREVADKGVVVRDEDIERYVESIKERNKISDEQLKQALAAQGMTPEAYRTQIREDLQRQQLIAREIRGKVSVTPEDIQRYYDAHSSEYATPERLQVAHIVFRLAPDAPPDRVAAITAKADEVRARLKKSDDFAALAKQYSEDATSEQGGELGWFKKGELLEPMEQAAAKLKIGDVSEPIRTKVGLHIVKLEGREGAGRQNIEEHAEQIKQQLYNVALEERFQKWMTGELRQRHHVEMK